MYPLELYVDTFAPDTQLAIFEFEDFVMEWEHKLCSHNLNEETQLGCYFYGTKGTFHLGWLDGWTFFPKNEKAQKIHVPATLTKPDYHNVKESWFDFVQAIDNNTLPTCDIETGHLATSMSLQAMISMKLGRSIKWDGKNEKIIGDDEANKLLVRNYRGEWEFPYEV